MKKALAILFLFIFLAQYTRNTWILISFHIRQEYIANNLCVNRFDKMPTCGGKCYLNKQLQESEEKEHKFPNIKQKEIQLFTYFEQVCLRHFFIYKLPLVEEASFFYVCQLKFRSYSNSVFHPPSCA